MKKILALILALVMVMGLAACGSKTDGDKKGSGDPYHVKLSMATLMTVPSLDATKKVEDDINAYLKDKLGITDFVLDLTIISIADYFTTVPMELAAKQGPDLVMLFDSMPSYVDSGYIVPLDPYLDNELKGTVDLIGNLLENGKIDGSVYMIPRYFGTVLDWKFIYNKDLADGVYDMSQVKSLNDLDGALAALKTAYPDEHFLVYSDQFPNLYQFMTHTSVVGLYGATVGDDPTIVNYYETDAYKDAIKKAYEYRQKGYLDPEGSTNTMTHDEAIFSGSSKGVIMGHSADIPSIVDMFDQMNFYGAKFDAVTIAISDLYTDTVGIGLSYTSGNPAAAAKFIDLLYTDEFVWEALIYGSEGQDYVWNADHTAVDYPEGLDANTIPYNCMYSCGIIGNGMQGLPFENNNSGSSFEYGKELMDKAWAPPLYGFTPSNGEILNEIAAVSNVISQYDDVLKFGDVNPDDVHPQFIADLKTAGMDKIIAEFQTQAQAWLAANK